MQRQAAELDFKTEFLFTLFYNKINPFGIYFGGIFHLGAISGSPHSLFPCLRKTQTKKRAHTNASIPGAIGRFNKVFIIQKSIRKKN